MYEKTFEEEMGIRNRGPHEANFSRYLSIAFAKNEAQKKELIAKIDPALRWLNDKGEEKPIRELLQSEDISGTTILQTEYLKTVWEGAEQMKCFREALPIVKLNSNSVKLVYEETGTYADPVSEGAEYPDYSGSTANVTLTVKKIGVKPRITDELIADSLFDVVALRVRKAGNSIENSLNRDALIQLMDNASATSVDVAAAPMDLADIANQIGYVMVGHWIPDRLILEPMGCAELMQNSNLLRVGEAGTDMTLRTGKLGPLLGLATYLCSVSTAAVGKWAAATNTWGNADTNYQAMVFDSANAGVIGMREDITVEKFRDPDKDLMNAKVRMRYDVKKIFSSACGIIQAA